MNTRLTRRSLFQLAVLTAATGTAGLAVALAPNEAEAREKVRDHRRCRLVIVSPNHARPVCGGQ